MADEGIAKKKVGNWLGRSLCALLPTFLWIALLVPGPARAVVMSAGSDTVQVGEVFTILQRRDAGLETAGPSECWLESRGCRVK
jgi:hypothetical protein